MYEHAPKYHEHKSEQDACEVRVLLDRRLGEEVVRLPIRIAKMRTKIHRRLHWAQPYTKGGYGWKGLAGQKYARTSYPAFQARPCINNTFVARAITRLRGRNAS
jgi:hypothetical protein